MDRCALQPARSSALRPRAASCVLENAVQLATHWSALPGFLLQTRFGVVPDSISFSTVLGGCRVLVSSGRRLTTDMSEDSSLLSPVTTSLLGRPLLLVEHEVRLDRNEMITIGWTDVGLHCKNGRQSPS